VKALRELLAAWLRRDAAAVRRQRRELALLLVDGEAEELTFQREGLTWTVRARRHTITRNLFVHGRHPGAELAGTLAWLRARGRLGAPFTTVVDVGANVGAPTLFLARETGLRVVAVEPVPGNFELLLRNVEANGCGDRVRCVRAAVAEVAGEVVMLEHPKDGQSEVREAGGQGFGRVTAAHRSTRVRAARLDEILAGEAVPPGEVAFVWSDTQGFETQVVRSGPSLWRAGAPIYVEVWPEGLAAHGGVEAFLGAAAEHFAAFVPRRDLRERGEDAAPRPLAELPAFVRELPKQTDVLLLP